MLIESGQVKHLLPETAMRPGDDVRDDLFVGVTEVRFAVDVIDGGGQVKPFTHPRGSMRPWPSTWQSQGEVDPNIDNACSFGQGRLMHISLMPELEKVVRKKMKSGLYNNASEVTVKP